MEALNKKNLLIATALFLSALTFQSCGGGGSSSSGGGTSNLTKLSGTVSAPGGSIAKPRAKGLLAKIASFFVSESIAQSTGLQPVANTNVLVFRIDNAGNPTGGVIASGTTDASGNYSVNLPAGTGLSGNIIVQATGATTPQPVNGSTNNNLNCPAVNTTLNIDPAAQVATAAILQNIAANSGQLSNFTNAEIAAFVNLVQTFAQDPTLVGADIQTTITNIKTKLQDLINTTLTGIATPGEATPPATFGGVYNFLGFNGSLDSSGGIGRRAESGTVTIDATAKTFSFTGTGNEVRLSESCGTSGAACDRSFTQSTQLNKAESASGTYTLGGNGQIFFNDSKGGIVPGMINPAGTLVVLSFPPKSGGDMGIGVAIKQGTPTPAGTFNWNQLKSSLSGGSLFSGPVPVLTTGISNGVVTLTSSSFSGTGTRGDMTQSFTCSSGPSGPCNFSGAISEDTTTAENPGGTLAASANGSLTLTDPQGGTNPGALSADGNFLLVQGENGANGNVGLILGTLQGSGMSLASLNGTYNFVAFEDNLDLSGGIENDISSGAVTFNGTGGFTVLGSSAGIRRNESCGGTTCPSVSLSARTENFSAKGTYVMDPKGTGDLTFSGTDTGGNTFSFPGSASADGSVVVLRQIRTQSPCGTNCADAGRMLIIGVKQ